MGMKFTHESYRVLIVPLSDSESLNSHLPVHSVTLALTIGPQPLIIHKLKSIVVITVWWHSDQEPEPALPCTAVRCECESESHGSAAHSALRVRRCCHCPAFSARGGGEHASDSAARRVTSQLNEVTLQPHEVTLQPHEATSQPHEVT